MDNTLVDTSTCSESETTIQPTRSNGSRSMPELTLSELTTREPLLLPTEKDTVSKSTTTLSSENSRVTTPTELDGLTVQEETSRTTEESASLSRLIPTPTTDTSSSTTVTTISAKAGGLTKEERS